MGLMGGMPFAQSFYLESKVSTNAFLWNKCVSPNNAYEPKGQFTKDYQ